MLQRSDIRDKLATQGMDPAPNASPADFKAANLRAQQANERMSSEVRDLKEGLEMVEEKARMELGMVKPNEVYIQVAATGAKSTPSPVAAAGPVGGNTH